MVELANAMLSSSSLSLPSVSVVVVVVFVVVVVVVVCGGTIIPGNRRYGNLDIVLLL